MPLQCATRIVLVSIASGGIEESEGSEHFPITKSRENVQSPESLAVKTRIHAPNRLIMVVFQRVKQASANQAGTSRREALCYPVQLYRECHFSIIAGTPCFTLLNMCGTGVEGIMTCIYRNQPFLLSTRVRLVKRTVSAGVLAMVETNERIDVPEPTRREPQSTLKTDPLHPHVSPA